MSAHDSDVNGGSSLAALQTTTLSRTFICLMINYIVPLSSINAKELGMLRASFKNFPDFPAWPTSLGQCTCYIFFLFLD